MVSHLLSVLKKTSPELRKWTQKILWKNITIIKKYKMNRQNFEPFVSVHFRDCIKKNRGSLHVLDKNQGCRSPCVSPILALRLARSYPPLHLYPKD